MKLRPEALATALYMGAQVREISGAPSLRLTRAEDGGWTFRVSRRYTSPQQALAFQYVLDRLQVLNVIAWSRTTGTIDVTAGRDAKVLKPCSTDSEEKPMTDAIRTPDELFEGLPGFGWKPSFRTWTGSASPTSTPAKARQC